jgi:hypothetical protein
MGWGWKDINQLSDLDPKDAQKSWSSALDDAFDKTYPETGFLGNAAEFLSKPFGKDYQKHIFNVTGSGGNLLAGGTADYTQAREVGDSDYATGETLEQAKDSASILAAILAAAYGVGAYGGEAAGSGAEFGALEAGAGAEAYPLASSADTASMGLGGLEYGSTYSATPYANSVASATGGGGAGFDYTKMLSSALGNMGDQKTQQGSEGGGSRTDIRESDFLSNPGALNPNSQQAASQSAPADPYAPQQYGAYGAPYQQELRRKMLAAALSGSGSGGGYG